ncbi:MAG: DUF1801 domain-containing protein [Pedobacter sp.]|nr:MAG: DUF1801 domain-containing protein [Pedobacter sp.]
MAENKTVETSGDVVDFINSVEDESKKADCLQLAEIFEETTAHKPAMWGKAIVGFGSYHYKYVSGHEGQAPLVAFSPRKKAISLYLYCDDRDREYLLSKLGKHKSGKGCIYINKLDDIDISVLKELIVSSVSNLHNTYTTASIK